jgi:hypothetical protein
MMMRGKYPNASDMPEMHTMGGGPDQSGSGADGSPAGDISGTQTAGGDNGGPTDQAAQGGGPVMDAMTTIGAFVKVQEEKGAPGADALKSAFLGFIQAVQGMASGANAGAGKGAPPSGSPPTPPPAPGASPEAPTGGPAAGPEPAPAPGGMPPALAAAMAKRRAQMGAKPAGAQMMGGPGASPMGATSTARPML